MRIGVTIGLGLTAVLAVPAVSGPPKAAETTYVDPTYGYSVTYPASWQFKPPNADGRIFMTSPLEGPQDNFKENVNFVLKKFGDPSFELRGKCADFMGNFAQQYEAYKAGQCADVTWNGVNAMRADYSFDKTDNGTTRRIHALQTFAIKNDYLYIVTLTAIESTYPRYLPIANKVIASIKIP
ncbi:MAG: PsbP-related protein [Novosphingobium sp.]